MSKPHMTNVTFHEYTPIPPLSFTRLHNAMAIVPLHISYILEIIGLIWNNKCA